MGRNRPKAGAGAIGQQVVNGITYSDMVLPIRRFGDKFDAGFEQSNGVIKNQALPDGWEPAGFGGGRSLRGGVDGYLPDGRMITIKSQAIGGSVVVNIDGTDYYYPVENVRDYVVEPDLDRLGERTYPAMIDEMTVFDFTKLIPEVMQAVQQWNERRQQIALKLSVQERARADDQWNNQTQQAFSRTLPSKSPNESDDEYIARLKQDAAQRAKVASRIDDSLLHGLTDRSISNLMEYYRSTLQSMADRAFPMMASLSPKARRAARDYLYGQMAQVIRIAGKVETIQDQRRTLGNKGAIGVGLFRTKAEQKSKMMSFADRSRQVQKKTYNTMKQLVKDSLEYRIGRGTQDASFTPNEIKELVQQPRAKF